jgi:hypothetical protein
MNGRCPRYMTRDPGAKCTDYMVSLHDSVHDRRAFDQAMFDYCARKYTSEGGKIPPECECILRNEDPDYRQAILQASGKQLSKEADQCWYLPCRDGQNKVLNTSMMTPGDPKTVYMGTDVCTGVTCSQLVDARGATLGVAFIDQKTGCSNEVKSGKEEEGGGEEEEEDDEQQQQPTFPPSNTTTTVLSSLVNSDNALRVTGIAVGALLVVLMLAIIASTLLRGR